MNQSLENLHILVVEDTLTQALMIQHVLEKEAIKVTIARSGSKALTVLAELKPDIILCDVNMPEMNGFEVCTMVKADASLAAIPFILLSSLVDNADLLKVLHCGADNFIYKTFEDEYFLHRLKSIWSSWKLEKRDQPAVSVSFFVDGDAHTLETKGQRLSDLLVSAFEAAVFHNRALKSGS